MGDRGTLRVIGRNVQVNTGEVARLSAGPYVRLSIVDEGPGIARDLLTRVFDPFFTTKTSGSGLGLSTAYAIAARHDGTIEAESELGAGATFHLFLPGAPGKPVSTVPRADSVHQGSGIAVVMDDEAPVRDVLCRMLQRHGYDVVPASDGAEAIAAMQKLAADGTSPAIVFLDLTVRGGMGGKEALASVRALCPTAAVIASSGYSDDPEMADPNAHGFAASLRKPFRMAEIAALLEDVARRRNPG
jgi:CheY-like chemotaxis protein